MPDSTKACELGFHKHRAGLSIEGVKLGTQSDITLIGHIFSIADVARRGLHEDGSNVRSSDPRTQHPGLRAVKAETIIPNTAPDFEIRRAHNGAAQLTRKGRNCGPNCSDLHPGCCPEHCCLSQRNCSCGRHDTDIDNVRGIRCSCVRHIRFYLQYKLFDCRRHTQR